MLAAYRCLYPEVVETGGATVLRAAEAPDSPMLNRIVGLGLTEPATEAGLDQALAAIGDDVTCYVSVAPGAHPDTLEDWLRSRGLEPGWGWMAFRRGVAEPPAAPTSLRLEEVDAQTANSFGRVVAVGYGLPAAIAGVWLAPIRSAGSACSRSTATSRPPRRVSSSTRGSVISVSRRPCPSIAGRAPSRAPRCPDPRGRASGAATPF